MSSQKAAAPTGGGPDRRGLALTSKIMQNYRAMEQLAGDPEREEPQGCHILDAMQRSRARTHELIQEIDKSLEAVTVAARAAGYDYKVDAFTRRYIQGQTYEEIADALNCGRNSPARWCGEIMEQMAVQLFGVDGIAW